VLIGNVQVNIISVEKPKSSENNR